VSRAAILVAGRIALGIALVAAWELTHRALGADTFSSLADIGRRIAEIAGNGTLWKHARVTLVEAAAGMALGGGLGAVLPFALRLAPRLERAIDPYIAAAMGVPKLALAPLLILWFGIGLASKVVFVAAVVFFLVFFSTTTGLRSADAKLLAMTRVWGASRALQMRAVLLPAAMPHLLASLKVAVPRAISAAVVGEFIAADAGLGYYVHHSQAQADTVGIFAGVLVVTVVVVVANAALERIQTRTLAWRGAGLSGF